MRPADVSALSQLAEPLRSRIAALLQAAGDAVWISSGRRTTEAQVELRRRHCGTSWYDIYQKPASQCSPPTAIPGRSKHESGAAVDLGGDLGLAARLAKKLGLHTPVRGEAWHFETDPNATVQGLTGMGPLPIDINVPGPFDDAVLDTVGEVTDAVTGALGDALGALVEPLVSGAARVALVGTLVAGGVVLVVLGGVRGTQPLREAV